MGVKFHGVSGDAHNAESVNGHPAKDTPFPMLPETVRNGLEEEDIDGEGSYD